MNENDRSYESALKATGAKVLAYDEFGSYQGDWLAKVEYKGKIGWIHDYYGSCSGCDAFKAELSWSDQDDPIKLSAFGMKYIEDIKSYEEVFDEIKTNHEWDMSVNDMMKFMEENK